MYPWDVANDGSSAWTPAIYLGDSDGVPGSWFDAGPVPSNVGLGFKSMVDYLSHTEYTTLSSFPEQRIV